MVRIAGKIARYVLYLTGIWRIIRFFTRRRPAVLMYHGVCDKDLGVWTQLPREKFEKQMKYLRKHYRVRKLSAVVSIIRKEARPVKHVAALTFDDGFKNNLTIAYPILKDMNIPSTIFLTTSFADKSGRFGSLIWTDYVGLVLQNARNQLIDLQDLDLGIIDLGLDKGGKEARKKINANIKKLDHERKNHIVEILARRADLPPALSGAEMFRGLEWEDVKNLNDEGLVQFEAHTVNHEILTRVPEDICTSEIKEARTIIEEKTGKQVTCLAYPNGTRDDFDQKVKKLTAEYYRCGFTTINGLNRIGRDPYELKRVNIGNDTSFLEFKLALSGTLDFIRWILRQPD